MRALTFLLYGALFATGISVHAQSASTASAPATIPTYKTFADQQTTFGYHKTAKKVYTIERIPNDSITYGEPQSFMKAAAPEEKDASSGLYYSNAEKCTSDIFAGHDRAVAKTHEVRGRAQVFSTFDDFYRSGLVVPDDQMLEHDPTITRSAESPRVAEEDHNVTINTAYIYGIYREDDNDFHMIIGNGETGSGMVLFNAEISGLPGDANDKLLIAVRNKIIGRFGDIACRSGAFKPVDTLIPIKITGSIFFDVDHKAGVVGFGKYKPKTAWEIHPVTGISFLDE